MMATCSLPALLHLFFEDLHHMLLAQTVLKEETQVNTKEKLHHLKNWTVVLKTV